MTNSSQYKFADVKRYAHGEMTPMEIRDFENALLQDHFLGDTVEEYLKSIEANRDNHEIDVETMPNYDQAKLNGRKSKQFKIVHFVALFIIITGASILIYTLLPQSHHDPSSRQGVGNSKQPSPIDTLIAIQPTAGNNTVIGIKKYKLPDKAAFFYSAPTDSAKRHAYALAMSATEIVALKDENGFVYVSVKNEQNDIITGWFKKADLIEINH